MSHLTPAVTGKILGWKQRFLWRRMFYPTLDRGDPWYQANGRIYWLTDWRINQQTDLASNVNKFLFACLTRNRFSTRKLLSNCASCLSQEHKLGSNLGLNRISKILLLGFCIKSLEEKKIDEYFFLSTPIPPFVIASDLWNNRV